MILNSKRNKNIEVIKEETGNPPDIIYKDIPINHEIITILYSKCVCDEGDINDFILRRLDEEKRKIKTDDLFNFIKYYIPNSNAVEIYNTDKIIYYAESGFTIILFDGVKKALAFENKAKLDSGVQKSEVEKSVKGPLDAFTQNYSINIGLIRRKLKTADLWLEEMTLGKKSMTRVAMFYMHGKADSDITNNIRCKLNNIGTEYIGDTNFLVEAMSRTGRTAMPTVLTTERPDYACELLMEGRVIIMAENSNNVIVLPTFFMDFFKAADDFHQKPLNVFLSRTIRIIAFLVAIITPALYIALMAFNWEMLPAGLLINFSVQRDGVPFPSVVEILLMGSMFQILRESDLRFPGSSGSSLSIVGAIVLGQAAVEAGIVSPITIIVVGISAVASLAFNSIEMINAIRIWELFLIALASVFGMVGLVLGIIIITAKLVSISSCNEPYLFPLEPFHKNALKNFLAISKKYILKPFNVTRKEKTYEKNN